jgi:hypothetical protein
MPVTNPKPGSKPCVLQVNNSGAWKTVLHFDAAIDIQVNDVQNGAELLHNVNQASRFRIATDDGLQTALMHLEKGQWRNA